LTPRFISGNCSGYRSVFSCQRATGPRPGPPDGGTLTGTISFAVSTWWR